MYDQKLQQTELLVACKYKSRATAGCVSKSSIEAGVVEHEQRVTAITHRIIGICCWRWYTAGCARRRRLYTELSSSANETCCPAVADARQTSSNICLGGTSSSSARTKPDRFWCDVTLSSFVRCFAQNLWPGILKSSPTISSLAMWSPAMSNPAV